LVLLKYVYIELGMMFVWYVFVVLGGELYYIGMWVVFVYGCGVMCEECLCVVFLLYDFGFFVLVFLYCNDVDVFCDLSGCYYFGDCEW